MRLIKSFIAIVSLGVSAITFADITGAEEAALLIKAGEQLEALNKQYNELKNQASLLEKTKGMMEGHYGYSNMFENQALKDWQHSGSNWDSAINNQGNDVLSQMSKKIEQQFPLQEGKNIFSKNANPDSIKLFDLMSKTTLASRATHTLAFNKVEEELKLLESLQDEIERSPNQKATLDLIARIQIEEAKLMAYSMKAEAVDKEQGSLQTQEDLKDDAWLAKFLR